MHDTILIAEDEPLQRLSLREMCEALGYGVAEAENGEEALFMLEHDAHIGVVLTDLSMPVMDGKTLIKTAKARFPDIPVVVLTVSRDLEDVVEVMKLGAQDFLTKPVEKERLRVTLANLLEKRTLRREVTRLQRKERDDGKLSDLIGHDGSLRTVCELGQKIAGSELPLLITGETGTGKEEIARAIHGESRRRGRPFISVNCHAIPDYLAEPMLFGEPAKDKGDKTCRIGKCREAQGGTLFLNGIEALSLPIQTRLLRLLQEGKLEAAGSTMSQDVDLRIIAATTADLREQVHQGGFSDDLYYRLAALRIDMPPLRERQGDIEALAVNFMKRIAAMEGKSVKAISHDALQWMQAYHWPGNVREMENLLSGAFFIADDLVISARDLAILSESRQEEAIEISQDGSVCLSYPDGTLKTLERVQDETIAYALNYFNQNVTRAAEALDIGRSTLFKRLRDKQDPA